MKNKDCLSSDIQNLCNAVSDWLIQKIINPTETNETISEGLDGVYRLENNGHF